MTPIILFDVDQTLLWSGGAGSLAMRRAFHRLYGVEDGFRRVEFSGRTDWSILRAALRGALRQHEVVGGKGDGAFLRELARFQEAYYPLLDETLREVEGGRVLPGVAELLAALEPRDGVRLGLETGNFRRAALMKLRYFGLDGYLSEGGFGDDAEERNDVVGIAIDRVASGRPGAPVWVVGDTPLDIDAAHANGARAFGVATGAHSIEELHAAGAEVVLEDLSDTEAALAALLDPTG